MQELTPVVSKATGPNGTANYELYIGTDGSLTFIFWTGRWHVACSSRKIVDTFWHHVAVTYDRNNICLYIDGLLDSCKPETTAMIDSGEDVLIGLKPTSWPFDYSQGLLDEVRIHNRALSETEIADLYAVCEAVLTVAIDIKPGSYPNAINLGSHGLIPVAILSSEGFDATTVDPDTVELAGATVDVKVKGKSNKYMAHEEDVDKDGLIDLVIQVATANLDPDSLQDGYAVLTAETYDGQNIEGEDEITIVPPEQ